MSTVPYLMAQCRSCGWLGAAHERKAQDGATEELYCPQCRGLTRAWGLDLAKEQEGLSRLQAERCQVTQKSLDAYREARLASERLQDARQQVKRAQARLMLAEVNNPGDARRSSALQQQLAAEREVAEAALARDQAVSRVRALR